MNWFIKYIKPLRSGSGRYWAVCFLIIHASASVAQSCIPDTTIVKGFSPERLRDAFYNEAYADILQFKVPIDTTLFYEPLNTAVSFKVDSMVILSILGLPSGISYQCNTLQCKAYAGESGCVKFEGTTTLSGAHQLYIITETFGNIKGAPPFPDIPQVLTDTITDYYLFVNWPTGITDSEGKEKVQIYPNPAGEMLTVRGNQQEGIAEVYNSEGKHLAAWQLIIGTEQHINVSGWSKGFYTIRIIQSSGVSIQKLCIE